MANLDILFIRPNSKQQNYGELDSFKLTAIEPPLWPAMLAAYCRQQGMNVDIIDAEVEGYGPKSLAYYVSHLAPKTIVINVCGHNPSSSTPSMVGVRELIDYIKLNNFDGKIVLHGLHPSALPILSIRDTNADAVIVGEGFDVITSDCWWQGIYQSHNLIDLQILPTPAWDLLKVHKYRAHAWHCFGDIESRQGYGVVYTSLGCPNNCSFCVIHTMTNNQRLVRYRTVEQVMRDIDFWVEHDINNIRLIDENFTINRKHTIAVCKAITARYSDALNIWAYASPNTLDVEVLDVIRRAGIQWLGVGFESPEFREKTPLNKSFGSEEDMEIIAMLIKHAGININANWLFGLEHDTFGSMQNTLHLAQRINSEWANLYCVIPYPGSRLYDDAIHQGLPLPTSWDGYSQYSPNTLPLPNKHLQSKDILAFRDYAFKTYYSNPFYQNMINKKFGMETVNHIKDMLKIEIKRNIL